ncbi:hypothetical protein WMO79_01335 [Micrococcaceae bacterium Sec7.4]
MTTPIDPAEARDYLTDHLNLEAEEHPGHEDWYYELEDHLAALGADHSICRRLAVALEPFLNDDERIECTMYPIGEAITFLEQEPPGGPFTAYLEGLTSAIEADHGRWVKHVAAAGDAAAWTLQSGPPRI